ncbi:hypothetical protein L6164_023606 [Bauhinia variegata]|uniref:Uncharacterized protein n=1 Tax=Bauhinia variegata TaxID=167791 RepID=A0ACB9MJ65_BAUVA|nr:hypothetical protein L6164_023606 [Bauhinia variegata]
MESLVPDLVATERWDAEEETTSATDILGSVGVTFPLGYREYDDLRSDDVPTPDDLSQASWISSEVRETDTWLNKDVIRAIRDTLCDTSNDVFGVEACPPGVGVCEDQRAMPNLCKFMERLGSEVENLQRKKRKVGEFSSVPSVIDYFSKALDSFTTTDAPSSVPGLANLDTANLSTFTPTNLSTHVGADLLASFNDPLEDHACPPLARWGTRVKTTARKDPSSPESSPIRVNVDIPTSGAGTSTEAGGTAAASGANSTLRAPPNVQRAVPPLSEGFPPLNPTALLAEFKDTRSDAMLGELGTAFYRCFGIVQVLYDRINAEQRSSVDADRLRAEKDAAEDQATVAEKKAIGLEERAISAEQKLEELKRKDAESTQLAADLRSTLLAKDQEILSLQGKVEVVESATRQSSNLAARRKIKRDQAVSSRLRVMARARSKLENVFVSACREGFENCLDQIAVFQNKFTRAELAAVTDFMKEVRDGSITESEDDDDPDLDFPVSDLDFGSDGEEM